MNLRSRDNGNDGQPESDRADAAGVAFDRLPDVEMSSQWVPIKALLPADSPRLDGEDHEHAQMLANIEGELPPIIVLRASMRVIDGMHRLHAAAIRGDEKIAVRFFEGTEADAFLVAVKANIEHGRPLSLADRSAAAERIVASHPTWSNRAVAAAAGLGPRTVAEIRRRLATETGDEQARQGRDGRWRPVVPAGGRIKAMKILQESPEISMREVARRAGISPSTALDVRNRLRCGEDPVLTARHAEKSPAASDLRRPESAERALEVEFEAMLQGLANDPSLQLSESGPDIVRWMLTRLVRPSEWQDLADSVPSHCRFILLTIASRCAGEWRQFADDLEQRAQTSA
jgi:hypothetical protein